MLYVGLTEEHKESATMFANVVGMQMLSLLQALSSSSEQERSNRTGGSYPLNHNHYHRLVLILVTEFLSVKPHANIS